MMIDCHFNHPELLENLLKSSLAGLQTVVLRGELQQPASYRLPFREFGLCIGLQAVQRFQQSLKQKPGLYLNHTQLCQIAEALMQYQPLQKDIVNFWKNQVNQTETWEQHLDINSVMLATSLAPDGFLSI